jgi:hypothetical protein
MFEDTRSVPASRFVPFVASTLTPMSSREDDLDLGLTGSNPLQG